MEKYEMIYLASKFADKGWDYEKCMYGDDLYNRSEFIDDIWEYVIELKEIGSVNFYQKYKEFKLF